MGVMVCTSMYSTTAPHMLEVMGAMALCMMACSVQGKGGRGSKDNNSFGNKE